MTYVTPHLTLVGAAQSIVLNDTCDLKSGLTSLEQQQQTIASCREDVVDQFSDEVNF